MAKKRSSSKERRELARHDKAERIKIFEELLDHLREGYSIDCFKWLSFSSIEEWCKTFSEEFDREKIEDALREGKDGWEEIGRKQAVGTCLGNSRSWYYNMANRYGWSERAKIEQEHKGQVAVQVVSYARHDSSDTDAQAK